MKRIVFLDTETGGLQPKHPTIQLAAIAVDPEVDWREVETFERKIAFDPAACDAEALAINHYTEAAWKDAPTEAQVVAQFADFLGRHRSVELKSKRTGNPYTVARIAGHNVVGFDIDRVGAMFKRHNVFFPVDFRTVLDTRYGSVWHFEGRPDGPADFKLTGLAKHFGIAAEGAHDALVDVRLSIALARRLLKGRDRLGRTLLTGDFCWIKARGVCEEGWQIGRYDPGALDGYGDWWITGHELPAKANEIGDIVDEVAA